MANTSGGIFNPNADIEFTGNITPRVVVYPDSGPFQRGTQLAVLTKATAADMTIHLPQVTGTTITIVAGSAAGHVITSGIPLFYPGRSGAPFGRITLSAFRGATATLVAYEGLWLVTHTQNALVS